MRIGTRSLKVMAWLSAAILIASLLCIVCNSCDIDFAAEYKVHKLLVMSGAAKYIRQSDNYPGLFPDRDGYAMFFNAILSRDEIVSAQTPTFTATYINIPLWLPAACSLAVGAPAFVTLRRRARALKNGACPKCGYMLTGLSPAAPCPECGRANPAPR